MFFLITFIGIVFVGTTATDHFSYDNQDSWPGACVREDSRRQSPIDIITRDAQFDTATLTNLTLTGWEREYDGTFTNTNITAQFEPTSPSVQPTTENHLGTYILEQCHFHWGRRVDEGAEHLIDGDSGELEVHFVHRKETGPETAGDYRTVIAVIADVDDNAPVSGPWGLLNASQITGQGDSIPVRGFRYDQFLPRDSMNYYFYEGSLTAPDCNEIVAWFVLKERITVPGAYLDHLRSIVGQTGEPLTYNYRETQELNGRIVKTNSPTSSQAVVVKPVLALLLFCLLLA